MKSLLAKIHSNVWSITLFWGAIAWCIWHYLLFWLSEFWLFSMLAKQAVFILLEAIFLLGFTIKELIAPGMRRYLQVPCHEETKLKREGLLGRILDGADNLLHDPLLMRSVRIWTLLVGSWIAVLGLFFWLWTPFSWCLALFVPLVLRVTGASNPDLVWLYDKKGWFVSAVIGLMAVWAGWSWLLAAILWGIWVFITLNPGVLKKLKMKTGTEKPATDT